MTMRHLPWVDPAIGDCPVADTMRILGGKHATRVLHCLFVASEMHFLELNRALGGISRKVLRDQLREFEAAGLVLRIQKQDARRRVGYSLTEKGLALGHILSKLYAWTQLYDAPRKST